MAVLSARMRSRPRVSGETVAQPFSVRTFRPETVSPPYSRRRARRSLPLPDFTVSSASRVS